MHPRSLISQPHLVCMCHPLWSPSSSSTPDWALFPHRIHSSRKRELMGMFPLGTPEEEREGWSRKSSGRYKTSYIRGEIRQILLQLLSLSSSVFKMFGEISASHVMCRGRVGRMRFWQQELGGSSLSSSESDSVMRWAGTLWGREGDGFQAPRRTS